MDKKYSIVLAIAFLAMVGGCSATEDPLQGKWQGTVNISGKISLEELVPTAGVTESGNATAPRTEVAVMTLEFLSGDQLRLKTEPMPSRSPFGPDELKVSYTVLESSPGLYRLRLDRKDNAATLHLRFTSPENMTLTEEGGSPQLLPIVMTRMDAA